MSFMRATLQKKAVKETVGVMLQLLFFEVSFVHSTTVEIGLHVTKHVLLLHFIHT